MAMYMVHPFCETKCKGLYTCKLNATLFLSRVVNNEPGMLRQKKGRDTDFGISNYSLIYIKVMVT